MTAPDMPPIGDAALAEIERLAREAAASPRINQDFFLYLRAISPDVALALARELREARAAVAERDRLKAALEEMMEATDDEPRGFDLARARQAARAALSGPAS